MSRVRQTPVWRWASTRVENGLFFILSIALQRNFMPLHFTREEFCARQAAARAALAQAGMHGLLIFRQESMYYLSGYDTFGYVHFQCLYMDVDGAMTLLTREPDRRQAAYTSVIEDVRIWVDEEDANPYRQLRDILSDHANTLAHVCVRWLGRKV